ncbi:MAG: transcriptional repressor [Candidatus Eremiobacteraeota bacterium]|nr:transcriptional repressor [Candidatus Eremiobacteraeota bacterium]
MARTENQRHTAGPKQPASFGRSTRQRRAIWGAFERVGHPLSVGDVVAATERSGDPVSLTTAYRTIGALVDEGLLESIELPGAGTYFERAGKSHHHHFSCLRCSRAYELPQCETKATALPRGFRAVSHETTVFGLCATCARA